MTNLPSFINRISALTWKQILFRLGILALTGFLGLVLGIVGFFYIVQGGFFGAIPNDDELKQMKNYEASEVYSSDSVLLGRFFIENRSDATWKELSPHIYNALIATEDVRFYEHKGVDQRSLMRVLFKSIILQQKTGGGSTLTQQLAKNYFGRKNYGIFTMPVAKIKEAILANRIEHLYSKEEILLFYLNTVSFGENTYGIKTACERYFSTNTYDVSLEEAAFLIGLLKGPSYYNPQKHPERALKRRNTVLHQLYKYGYLTSEELKQTQDTKLNLNYKRSSSTDGIATYFRAFVKKEAEKILAETPKEDGSFYNLYTDGLKIKTTIHSKLQQYAEESVLEHLSKLQPKLEKELASNQFFKKNKDFVLSNIKQSSRYKSLKAVGKTEDEIFSELHQKVTMTVFTLKGEKEITLSPWDSTILSLSQLQAGFLVSNPKNGQILAWVGGTSFLYFPYDHVLSKRQVGSTFKPIVYAQALESGKQPCDFISNQEITYAEYDNWTPQNSGNENRTGNYSLLGAITKSVNTISVKLAMEIGLDNVIALAHTLGITDSLPQVPSLALGVADISLNTMVSVYGAFANNGIRADMQSIKDIKNQNGELIYRAKTKLETVLKVQTSKDITNMLCSVVDSGTAQRLRTQYHFQGQIAGKTGTTQNHSDGWFMGYTSRYVAGVWVGADQPIIRFNSIIDGQGANLALPIWANFYQKVNNDRQFTNMCRLPFPFENNLHCPLYKEENLLQKIFQKDKKVSHRNGYTPQPNKPKAKKKKRFLFF